MRKIVLILPVLLMSLAAQAAELVHPTGASADTVVEEGKPRVKVALLSDHQAVTRGQTFDLGLYIQMEPGWHVYWQNPGQAGLAPKVTWNAPSLELADLAWPAPRTFREAEGVITTYGYEDHVLLLAPATVAADAQGNVEVEATVNLLACAKVCIPGKVTVRRTLTLASKPVLADAPTRAVFASFKEQVPQRAEALGLVIDVAYSQSAIRPGDAFRAAIAALPCPPDSPQCPQLSLAGSIEEAFVPERLAGLEVQPEASRSHPAQPRGLVLTLRGKAKTSLPETDARLAGLLRIQRDGVPAVVSFTAPLPSAAAGTSVVQNQSPLLGEPSLADSGRAPVSAIPMVFLQMLFFAFLGGLILNLMPCVLPVLFLKVVGVARLAHEDRKVVLREDAAYAAGILASMGALGVLVVLLRKIGLLVGWGFQFQSPIFAAVLAAVLFVFALNLFGVFEVQIGAGSLSTGAGKLSGLGKSFFEGVLMVIVATPCSAPFLGTAVGFALLRSPFVIIATFLAIGLGLALPFVLITLMPGVARLVPKPGAWMVKLKQLLGFALAATSLWLVWLVGRFAGVDGMTQVLAFLLVSAVAAWLVGLTQGREGWLRPASLVLGLVLLVGAGFGLLRFEAPVDAPMARDSHWSPYSQAAVAQALTTGKPVFVNFTADWCITCKVNEQTVLGRDELRAAWKDQGVTLLKADWTRRDEAIRAELSRYGKAGVPMYLVYGPSAQEPIVLPEILTQEMILDALKKVAQ